MRGLRNVPAAMPRGLGQAAKIAVISLLGVLLPAGALFAATQTAKPSFTVQVSPASQSVVRGSSAAYTVTVTSQNGFAGTASLSAGSLPSAATAAFSPSSLSLTSGSTATSTLTVSTTSSTPVGTYSVQITATSGKTVATATAGLTVNYPLSGSFSLASTPASLSISPGSSGVYSLAITRTNMPGPITFSVAGAPSGVTASFSPNPATGGTSSLQVSASASAPAAKTTLYIVGSGQDPTGTTRYAYASVQFEVLSNGKAFTITGSLDSPLAPGLSKPLALGFSNPNSQTLAITNLSVTLTGVTRTADAVSKGLPCSIADYAVTQYSGPYPLAAPVGTSSLASLGVPSSQWPKVSMLDTTANQDGCKGATLLLGFSGSGQGN
ncbi:hypothetical protein SPF06_03465 [Sinomonas sp. JGH33]|uniref:Uncharacterized protein n=1 Tax=Sinomonas terricola TaxID=3110330 RepID=A0ABU5T284_9MICC|nr:hypothetical protein [Sinomonas sp. JGH33]MEA5453772.1 hypothetical protein [Sinomonas sp. JGH33]